MTTTLKPTRRETLSALLGRNICVELHPTFMLLRLKGKRFRYAIEYRAVFEAAAKLEARRLRDERIASRSRRKGAA